MFTVLPVAISICQLIALVMIFLRLPPRSKTPTVTVPTMAHQIPALASRAVDDSRGAPSDIQHIVAEQKALQLVHNAGLDAHAFLPILRDLVKRGLGGVR